MIQKVRRYLWRLLGVGLLLSLAVAAWCGSRWFDAEPGSAEDVFARIRIGMSQEEAVAVLRTYDHYKIDGAYSEGTTKQEHSWSRIDMCRDLYKDLPSPQEVVRCLLTVNVEDGREIEVALGHGGIVADKRLSPDVWQYRLQQTHRVLDRASSDLISGSWWREQLRKASRSLRHRRQYSVPFLAVVLVMVPAWVLRRRRARLGLNQARASAPPRDQRFHRVSTPHPLPVESLRGSRSALSIVSRSRPTER